MDDAITMSSVRKTFGRKVAVEGIDLVVPRGSLHGFIGPNGAGKTTTIRMIMAILFPDSGELSVLGRRSAVESKDRIGYLPEERGIYRKMKVGAFLRHMGRLKGLSGRNLDKRILGWLERVDLGDCVKKRCEELSKGMQQKVQFIASVLHEPELVILDEPFSGLDPVNMRLLRDLIAEQHAEGRTVIFSTHVMVQAEQLCDSIVMIHRGRKVLDGTLAEIRAGHPVRSILFEPLTPETDERAVTSIGGVRALGRANGLFEAELDDDADPSATLRAIAATIPVARIEIRRPSLEDIFVDIVQNEPGTPDGDSEAELRAALRGDRTEAEEAAEVNA